MAAVTLMRVITPPTISSVINILREDKNYPLNLSVGDLIYGRLLRRLRRII